MSFLSWTKNGQRTEYETFIFGHDRGCEHILIVSPTTVLKSVRKNINNSRTTVFKAAIWDRSIQKMRLLLSLYLVQLCFSSEKVHESIPHQSCIFMGCDLFAKKGFLTYITYYSILIFFSES